VLRSFAHRARCPLQPVMVFTPEDRPHEPALVCGVVRGRL